MKEADSVVKCRLARASFRLTAGFDTLIVEHPAYLSGYDSLKFSDIVSLHNFVRGKDSISVWLVSGYVVLTCRGSSKHLRLSVRFGIAVQSLQGS